MSIEGFATIDLPVSDYERLIHFMADCIAVGMGYTGHPDANSEPVLRQPFPRMIELGTGLPDA